MNDFSKQQLQREIETREKALAAAQRRLSKAPAGKLQVKTSRGHERFYKHMPKNEHPEGSAKAADSDLRKYTVQYLSQRNMEEILALADKRYCEALIKDLEHEIRAMRRFQAELHPEKKYDDAKLIPESLRDKIRPVVLPQEARCMLWQGEPFRSNIFPIDPASVYKTIRDESVRSRAECYIANALAARSLAYHYEELLEINSSVIYPDFTIMHPVSGELYYLEFFGMMDNPAYAEKALQKIRTYQAAGLAPRLICIFDSKSASFQTAVLDAILDSYFGGK